MLYWPLAGPFLAAVVIADALMVGLLLVGAISFALGQMGIGPAAAALLLLACLLGGAVNIPVTWLRGHAVAMEQFVSVLGIRYVVPVLRRRAAVVAVKVGGALIPGALSVYLIAHDRLGWQALAAVAIVAVLVHPAAVAGLAYVGGTLGTLAGADPANLGKVRRLGAPVASIGGAGTFDGVFLAGIIAVLVAALL